jgi:cytochrome c-type biogenesis protein CcmH/NrfG
MRTKLLVALLVVVLGFYLGLVAVKGVALIGEGSWQGIGLGLALLVLAPLGALLVWREIGFGRATARLGSRLETEGGLPADDLPRRPSGRVDRAAADEQFAAMRAAVEEAPEDWRAWYRLALAYDAAGDRSRARAAARKAITLS